MRIFRGVTELTEALGTQLGHSEWLDIDQHRIDAFADATNDHQWIHTDPTRAAMGPFRSTIAHGFLILSLLPALSDSVYRIEGVGTVLNYGTDKVRFPAPVEVGSRIRASFELIRISPATIGFQLTTKATVVAENKVKPACVVETLTIVVPS